MMKLTAFIFSRYSRSVSVMGTLSLSQNSKEPKQRASSRDPERGLHTSVHLTTRFHRASPTVAESTVKYSRQPADRVDRPSLSWLAGHTAPHDTQEGKYPGCVLGPTLTLYIFELRADMRRSTYKG